MRSDSYILNLCEECIRGTIGFIIRKLKPNTGPAKKCDFCGKKKLTFVCEVISNKKG